MNTEIIKASDYGLESKKTKGIEEAFAPKIAERLELAKQYSQIISNEITPELVEKVKILDKGLQKCEKGIFDVHKTQKAFFLAAGRYVDAWKNKETEPIKQMREKCKVVKNHYAEIERERIENLEIERKIELSKFGLIEFPAGLGEMEKGVYDGFSLITKTNFEKAEKLRLEKEEADRIAAEKVELYNTRKSVLIEFWDYLKDDHKSADFGEWPTETFEIILNEVKENKQKAIQKAKKQEEENKKLKAEADAREAQIKKERLEREKAEKKAKDEADEKLKAEQKAKDEAEAKLKKIEKDKKDAIEADKKAKIEAEKAPLKEKLNIWINSITVGEPPILDETTTDIINKFESFKNWAKKEIEKI